MKVNNISYNYAAPQFTGNKNKKTQGNNQPEVVLVPVKTKDLSKYIKAMALAGLMVSPVVVNTSCSKIDTDYEAWVNPSPKYYKEFIYQLPQRKIDNVTLPSTSVFVRGGFEINENLNKNLNKVLNTLNIPRLMDGELPISMAWMQDGKSKSVVQMVLDGDASGGGKYVFNTKDYSSNNSSKSYKYTMTDDGDKINVKISGNGSESEYSLAVNNGEVNMYKNINGKSQKVSTFCESKLPNESGLKAHCVVKESFNSKGETTDLSVMSKFDVWSFTPESYVNK